MFDWRQGTSITLVGIHFKWQLMLGRLHVRFMYIIVWPVKVLTSQRMSMMIVFAIHYAKVFSKVAPNLFDALSLR